VLASTRIAGGTGAALDLGGFVFRRTTRTRRAGDLLPEKYNGPLKSGDR
jgi:hypothetical protein